MFYSDEQGSDFIKSCIPSLNSNVFITIKNKIPIVLIIKFLSDIFSSIPNEACLKNLSSQCIEKKISELLIMSEIEYLTSILCGQKYFMKYND
jgi:hypothetical protein